jgi:cardiolipin synthase
MQFKDIPNIITLFRIITIPIIIVTFYFDDLVFAHRLGALLFAIASLSDFFDGYIARKFNIVSGFGKMFDPIADKVLVGTVLLMLVKFRKIEVLPCILILAREFVVSGLREFLAEIKVSVPVSTLGKIKTFVQMGSITLLLLGSKGSGIESLDFIGQILLWSAALLTIVSSYSYLKASRDYM